MTRLETVPEKRLQQLRALIQHEIDHMTEEQLAVAIVVAKAARHGDPRALAILNEAAGE